MKQVPGEFVKSSEKALPEPVFASINVANADNDVKIVKSHPESVIGFAESLDSAEKGGKFHLRPKVDNSFNQRDKGTKDQRGVKGPIWFVFFDPLC